MLNDFSQPLFRANEPPLWASTELPDNQPEKPIPFDEPPAKPPSRTIYARIKYLLSEEGRRDSLRKGGNGKREQETGGQVVESELSLFTVTDDGQVSYDATGAFGPLDFPLPPHAQWKWTSPVDDELHWDKVPTWNDLMMIVRGAAQEIAAIDEENRRTEEETERVGREFMSDPTARATRIDADWVTVGNKQFKKGHKVATEAKRRAEWDQENLRKANRSTLATWVKQNGTDNQRQRLEAGLLPWAEALRTLEEHLFAPVADLPLYERFDPLQVCRCTFRDYDPDRTCNVKFKSVDATELNADEWDQFSRINALVPGASLQLREHTAECESDAFPQRRRGVIVKFTIDYLTIKREYALTLEA